MASDGINRADLPEIAPRLLSQEEKLTRKTRLLKNSLIFLIFYSCVHKVLIPVILKFVGTSRPEYADVDYWFIPFVVLGYAIKLLKSEHLLIRILMGAAVAHAVVQVYLVSRGYLGGWHTLSHLLSSIPVAGLSIFYLGHLKNGKLLLVPWVVALLVLTFSFFFNGSRESVANTLFKSVIVGENDLKVGVEPVKNGDLSANTTVPVCGATEMIVRDQDFPSRTNKETEIQIMPCGLAPNHFFLSDGDIWVRNSSDRSVNLHLLVKTVKGDRRNTNLLFAAQERKKVEIKIDEEAEAGILYSDAYPDFGLVALVPKGFKGTWFFSRLPLKIERLE